MIATSTTLPRLAFGFAARRRPHVTPCAADSDATRPCDVSVEHPGVPAFRFDAKDVDAAIDVIVALHLFAVSWAELRSALWNAFLGAALSINTADPVRRK